MTRLQYLSEFIVNKRCQLDGLTVLLKQLSGVLMIKFGRDQAELDRDPCRRGMDVEVGVEDEWRMELPAEVLLQHIQILFYPGQRIWGWGNNESTSKLESLELSNCEKVKYLPPLRCLPILRYLSLLLFPELEFMEEGDDTQNNATSMFFPCLEELRLWDLPKLNRWWSKVAAEATSSSTSSVSTFLVFSHLSILNIYHCPNLELKSFPLCPRLQVLELEDVDNNTSPVIKQELFSKTFCFSTCLSLQKITVKNCRWLSSISGAALPSLRELVIRNCCSLSSLHLDSPLLENIEIEHCDELLSIEMVEKPKPSLRFLKIRGCKQLKSLHVDTRIIASIEELKIIECPELRLSKTQDNMLLQEVDGHSLTRELAFKDVNGVLVEQWFSSMSMSSLQELSIVKCEKGLISLHIPSPHLQWVLFRSCSELTSVEIETTTHIEINCCPELKNLRIVHPNSLEDLDIMNCPKLELSTGVDWDSLTNLAYLTLCPPLPALEKLPQCLLQRKALGQLRIHQTDGLGNRY